MVRASKRLRQQEADTQSSHTTLTSMATPSYDYSEATSLPQGAIGPANWVDPVTYRQLRKRFSKRKATTKKKKTATKKRRTYRRSYGSYGGGSRQLSGMGPIVITGRGGYWADKFKDGASAAWKSLKRVTPEGTFSRLGQAAGGAMFGQPGAAVGNWLGGGVSNVLGFGDYAVKQNDLMMLNEGVPVPTFQDMNQGIVVCHREFIADIAQTQLFTNQTFVIQPGNHTTFPWLANIASQFEQYEILGCLFQFRSTASDFGTTTNMAMGTVIMATDYDTVDAAYQSKLEMENAQYSMSGKPSNDMIHPVECDPSIVGPSGLKYIRNGPVPTGKDNRLYDHGNFQIATTGMPVNGGNIGELWITYKIAFYKPTFNLGDHVKTDAFLGTSGPTSTLPLQGAIAQANNSIGCSHNGAIITFPPSVPVGSKWLLTYFVTGASSAGQVMTGFLPVSGHTLLYQHLSPPSTDTEDRLSVTAIIKTTVPNTQIQLQTTMLASPTLVQLFITQVDTDLV
ncbi:capsid protein [Crucivirus-373]|nr:capsid protein [Crucivirus-373]